MEYIMVNQNFYNILEVREAQFGIFGCFRWDCEVDELLLDLPQCFGAESQNQLF